MRTYNALDCSSIKRHREKLLKGQQYKFLSPLHFYSSYESIKGYISGLRTRTMQRGYGDWATAIVLVTRTTISQCHCYTMAIISHHHRCFPRVGDPSIQDQPVVEIFWRQNVQSIFGILHVWITVFLSHFILSYIFMIKNLGLFFLKEMTTVKM